ncbi:MAG: hypothetical protein PHR28_14940, partial [candidate division Zixibacteria bacterium]|nr:hypothetical protein [candidate division Zixibacteria bacterium]
MTQENWDPLAQIESPELLSATLKRQIKNILESYTGGWPGRSSGFQMIVTTPQVACRKPVDGGWPASLEAGLRHL